MSSDVAATDEKSSPIRYLGCGQLGDFIHQLSVINEKWLSTGRKGVLYISNRDCPFRNSLSSTFHDTYETIKSQPYIEDYKIWSGEPYDIGLSDWRQRPDIYDAHTFRGTFKLFYGVEWAKTPWLDVPIDKRWENTVFVSVVYYRPPVNIDFHKIFSLYTTDVMFITNTIDHYDYFYRTYELELPVYMPKTFSELCSALRSCKLFAGSLSAMLSIATACHIPFIIGNCVHEPTNKRISDLPNLLPKVMIGTDAL